MRKVGIITGVRRIGFHIAKELLEDGWSLAVVYLSSEKEVEKLKKYGEVLGIKADLSERNSYKAIVQKTFDVFGRIDAFIHLASPYFPTPLESLTEEDVKKHFLPIAEAFLFISKECASYMLKNEQSIKGRIIAFGDWATNTTPYKNYSAYFISKGALHTSVKVLAKEFAPYILVNAIALGPTLKPPDFSQEKWNSYIDKTPLKREVSIRDVVELTKFLLSVESMTGEIINLDSGRHISGECS
ncbi:SDR family oxidoreductase [Thermocrinis jamiesonii]|mgnify:FL=1|uniref:SDR family oxidoreductase n=1 Tax=Thermocrinis jamiesonii TaxID=1302351 RepID=UPI0004957351|nr:SDR family oxidoreductase [Thermocrinis jamiesonii]